MSRISKPKICLVCDVKGWAFDIIAQQIKKELSSLYDIKIAYFNMYTEPENLFSCLEHNKNCDLIHFFWRKSLLLLESAEFKSQVESHSYNYDEYLKMISQKLSTGVYDFLYLDSESIQNFQNIFNKYTKSYYVSSKKLYNEYLKIDNYKKPYGVVHDPIDYTNLKPLNLARCANSHKELVVGWVGNSARKVNNIDLKGLNTIIKPVIAELINEGYHIKEHYADRNDKLRTHKEMLEYYSEIDIYLCTSLHEGTPLPILEAMTCGIPIITTDVGIVREALGPKEQEYIIGDRQNGQNDDLIRANLKNKLLNLYQNRHLLKELSQENINSIKEYDGGKIKEEFAEYFASCLKLNDCKENNDE